MGKEDGHADKDFSIVSKTKCAKCHQDRNVGPHRILQLVQFLIFLNFQKQRAHVYNNLWKFHRNQMNGVGPCKGKCNTVYSDHDFSLISKVKCAKFHQDRKVGQHRILHLVQFLISLNFQNHREHVTNNLWKFHRNLINAVCSCMATPATSGSTIFISKITASICLQQLFKISAQSDERFVLL